jgi:hypothetical protein
MVGFGRKQAWLAVRDADPSGVVTALGARDLGAVAWRDGVDLVYLTDDRLVVTPPLPGAGGAAWTLVAGRWLLRDDASVSLELLSGLLDTEVQFFASYRVGERHRWGRAASGSLRRAFSYRGDTGEVIVWYGEPDPAELDLGLPPGPDEGADVLVSEQDVMHLAHAWSVDPTTLDGQPALGPLRALAVDPRH